MVQPPYLKAGDTIGLVAPASYTTKDELASALEQIDAWGVNLRFGKNLFRNVNSFAGSDGERLNDFQEMLDNPDVKAILCARGGYGSARIIQQIQFGLFQKHPKWIVGCSDICAIHAAVQKYTRTESLHAAMPRNMKPVRNDLISMQSLKEALFGEMKQHHVMPHEDNRCGTAEGILTGGNLSILYSLRGTPFDLDTENKILFIEDVNEYLYHIDRMITNLKLGGKFERLSGLIVGGMNNMKTSASGFSKPALDVIKEAVEPYDFPVMFGMPAGHVKPNKALILGRKITLQVASDDCVLYF